MEFTLLWAALTGFALLWIFLRLVGAGTEFDRLIGAAMVGLLVGRLVAMIGAGVNPITNPMDILVVRGGVDTVGAGLGAIVALLWSARDEIPIVDVVAPAALAGLAGWHGGCVWRNACLGAAGEVPWGWALDGSTIVRHPVELYAAILLLISAWSLTRIRPGIGTRAGFALMAAGGVRLLTQPWRPSLSGGPVWWYLAAVTLGALIVAMTRLRARAVPSEA